MNDFPDHTPSPASARLHARLALACLLCFQIVMCCLSLIYVAEFYARYKIVWFDKTHLYATELNIGFSQ
jgi:hypothetical protein